MDTATRPGGMSMLRKAPNEANWNRTSIACSERVNVDGCDHVYAKRTQFRVVEGGTSKRWPCRKLARRDARLTGFGIMPEAGTHAARNGIGGPGNWPVVSEAKGMALTVPEK